MGFRDTILPHHRYTVPCVHRRKSGLPASPLTPLLRPLFPPSTPLKMTFKNQKRGFKAGELEKVGGLTPARLMTSTGMTVSISSAPLAKMTSALLEAIVTHYVVKTSGEKKKEIFQKTFTMTLETAKLLKFRHKLKQRKLGASQGESSATQTQLSLKIAF